MSDTIGSGAAGWIKEIQPTARAHGISDACIRYAATHAVKTIDLPSHPTIKGTIVALLGADDNGIPLEIIAREDRSGGLSIFHADSMRASFLRLYRESAGF